VWLCVVFRGWNKLVFNTCLLFTKTLPPSVPHSTQAAAFSLSPTNQLDIELNKESIVKYENLVSDTREPFHFISTHAAELHHVNVQLPSSSQDNQRVKFHGEERDRSVQHTLDILEKASMKVMEAFQPEQIANSLHIMAKKQYKTCILPELERRVAV
jgi:hypothetical protein